MAGCGGQKRELVQYFCILSILLKMPGRGDDIAAPTEEEGRQRKQLTHAPCSRNLSGLAGESI